MAKRSNPKPSPLANLPEKPRYASRGGDKLQGALDNFSISVEGKICLDAGSSTGGFTDCLLQAGAKSVYAIDVGWGLLDYKLRNDPRVRVLERTNIRFMDPASLAERPALVTVDVSFISLKKILQKIWDILMPGGDALVLVKPQFETSPREAPGGIVREEKVRQTVLQNLKDFSETLGFHVKGSFDSPIKGRKGNREIFLHLLKP